MQCLLAKTPVRYKLHNSCGKARRGEFSTAHGSFNTPAFMPVGTQAAVKGVLPKELKELGAEIILANTYHLHLRPGEKLIKELGGLHSFMNWNGPILTDSGGFQVYSLSALCRSSDEGVIFKSHIDGAVLQFTPEKVVAIQEDLGVDIMMVLDECLPHDCDFNSAQNSLERTLRWARASRVSQKSEQTSLFGIVQGGMYRELRLRCAEELISIGFDGYAIGGLSVGESAQLREEMTQICTEVLPTTTVRYLMGVGTPADIVAAVREGVDMFDCVIPTRSARFGRLYTKLHHINIRNAKYRRDPNPIDDECDCYVCRNFSRAYLSHLYHSSEISAVILGSIHNLSLYQRLMQRIRNEIEQNTFGSFAGSFIENCSYYGKVENDQG